jgi:hypothetical protein
LSEWSAGQACRCPREPPRRTEHLRVTERYTRRDFGHLDIETAFDDRELYTKPFTVTEPHDLLPDTDIFESLCENEKDSVHLGQR